MKETGIEKEYNFFDEKDNFNKYTFAKYLDNKYGFVNFEDNDKLYYFYDGYYRPQGEAIVRKEIVKLLGGDFKKHILNDSIEILKGLCTMKRENFGEPANLINLENGVYDIEKDTIIDPGSDMLFLSKLPIKYDPEADCPKIKEFIKDIVEPDNVPLIQELFGYSIYREYTLNKAFMFIGGGENGKTTLTNLLEIFVGKEHSSSESLHDLLNDPYSKARLHRKYINVDSDISSETLKDTGTFKKLTGEDSISAHRKYERAFKFKNHAKLIFGANKLPRTRDDSKGFFRRWILIDFPYEFTSTENDGHKDKNPNILDEISTEEEMSGLFNWAIEGLHRLLENGKFSEQNSAEKTKKRWIQKADTLAAFIESNIKIDANSKMETQEFFEHYSRFCKKRNITPHDNRTVGKRIQKLIPKARKKRLRDDEGERSYYYINIKYRNIDEDDKNSISDQIINILNENELIEIHEVFDEIDREEDKIRATINHLKNRGEIFEPKSGFLKIL